MLQRWSRNSSVSIHAPAWGATLCKGLQTFIGICFNPRSRMGSDLSLGDALKLLMVFQSTLPHGERLVTTPCGDVYTVFQSTLPHGERHL